MKLKVWVASELDVSETGGPQEHLIGRWNAFSGRGHDVTVFAPQPRGTPVRELKFRFEPIALCCRPRQAALNWKLFQNWRERLKRERPDLIYIRAGQWLLAPAVTAVRAQIPFVCEINGNIRLNLRARRIPEPLVGVATQIERYVCGNARRVLSVGPELNEVLERLHGIDPRKFLLSPAGVDTQQFFPAATRPDNGVVIGYAGLFNWWHYLPTFIRALAALRERRPELCWRAVLAGYGDEETSLRAQVQKLNLRDRVQFTGRIDQERMPEVLRTFDIGVMPFRAFSIKFLQYAASGVPTIYPESPHFSWLGDPGVTYSTDVPPESERGFMGALARLVEDAALRRELGRRSRELAEQRLGWERVVELMERVFFEIVQCPTLVSVSA